MSTRSHSLAAASFLTALIIAPSVFFLAPQQARAQWIVFDPTNFTQTTISAIENTITAVAAPINTAANVAQQINTYVLQPLAFVLSGNLMKALTASVIQFVIGKANGTGVPQFVTDVRASMQTVSDSAALAYLKQVGLTNSPFAGSISAALNTDYLTKSSLAGFWAANMCTLAASSPNVPAYLAGDWSQGGTAAWFALTTQVQNNPYTLYQNAQAQMQSTIGPGVAGATAARQQELSWGNGFMSWCGADSAAQAANIAQPGSQQTITAADAAAAQKTCLQNGGSQAQCQSAYDQTMAAVGTSVAVSAGGGINPGDPCTNSDGTPGTIKTPGSVIGATLNKVLGGQQDQIVRLGNVGPQIEGILKDVGTIINTVNFASSLLGGTSGGLSDIGNTSASNPTSRLSQFAPTQDSSGNFTSGYAGVTQNGIYQSAATLPSSGADKLSLVTKYDTAWNSIGAAMNTASTSVATLANVCTTAADTAATAQWNSLNGGWGGTPTPADLASMQSTFIDAARAEAASAQSVLANVIPPVAAQVASAAAVSAAADAMVQKVQTELTASTTTAGSTYTADMNTLQTMPPTFSDVANALQQAAAFGNASSTPSGSLNVSALSLMDQMNLLNTNATTLQTTVCDPNSYLYVGTGG